MHSSQQPIVPNKDELVAAYAVVKRGRVPRIDDVVVALREELAKADADTRRVANLIAQDPALAGDVLRVVNSLQYRGVAEVESLHQAVVMLGMREVSNLATAQVVQRMFTGSVPLVHRVWESILEEARAAVAVSRLVSGVSPDEAYLFGIMHDVGTLLFAGLDPDYGEIWDFNARTPVSVKGMERRLFGTDHCTVGYLLARHWRLPETFAQAIYLHHSLSCGDFEDPHLRSLIAIIKLAAYLTSVAARDAELPELVQFRSAARRELMISDGDWEQLRADALNGFAW